MPPNTYRVQPTTFRRTHVHRNAPWIEVSREWTNTRTATGLTVTGILPPQGLLVNLIIQYALLLSFGKTTDVYCGGTRDVSNERTDAFRIQMRVCAGSQRFPTTRTRRGTIFTVDRRRHALAAFKPIVRARLCVTTRTRRSPATARKSANFARGFVSASLRGAHGGVFACDPHGNCNGS